MANLERYFEAGASVLMLLVLLACGLGFAWRVYTLTRTRQWVRVIRSVHDWVSPSYPMLGAMATVAGLAACSVLIGWTLDLLNLWPYWLAPVTS
ncbi:hypothetical protein MARCHEWKA_04770 [Brevundimonas phage vB_BpoS-Marchewka]|uniref:Uncharacterized protein n=1 Tax=Brevundimonas phage vB_BpoS-Marchewka TaxID=2948604 RepID=A0A9E7N353_9CAUD|nr:hypothetical protein MARCHEWKA_04770 [Brevundimonas phage vB_BpoS-Marchewka]